MRHQLRCRHLRVGQRHGQQRLAFAPALSSRGVHEAPGSTALIAPACVTLRLQASHRRAARGAIDLAPVAAAAYQRRRAAACAQEASRRLVAHEHPGKLPRLCCWTGSSAGATLVPHPLSHDTVKGTANGSNCQVGAAAVPAYLGVSRLQRHIAERHHRILAAVRRPHAQRATRTAATQPRQSPLRCTITSTA